MKKNTGIKNKLMMFITCAVVIPSFLISIIITMVYIHYMNDKIKDNYNYISTISYNNATDMFLMYDKFFNKIINDEEIIKTMNKLNNVSDLSSSLEYSKMIDLKVSEALFENELENEYQITLYCTNENVTPIGVHVASVTGIMHKQWYKSMPSRGEYVYINDMNTSKKIGIARYMYDDIDFFGSENKIAIVSMEFDLNSLFKNTTVDPKKLFCIEIRSDDYDVAHYGNGGNYENLRNKYVFEKQFINDNWRIRYIFNMNEEHNIIWVVALIWSIVLIVLLLLEVFIGFKFSKNMNNRMSFIINKIHNIQSGIWDYEKRLGGEDEFAVIDDGLNTMSKRIEKLINDNYIIEIEKKKAELMSLQSQINPHFIYNTLESISSIAKLNKCDRIAVVSQKMADIMRYNLKRENVDTVTLYQEIMLIEDYFDIQKIRFEERINVFYDIPEELHNARVLKFLLQPIVENVIKHVIQKDLERHMIVIKASADENTLNISIIDDGDGVDEVKLARIQKNITGEEADKNSGIGLKNINSRLKIIFGKKYGLYFKSVKGMGTEVMMKMPLRMENEDV